MAPPIAPGAKAPGRRSCCIRPIVVGLRSSHCASASRVTPRTVGADLATELGLELATRGATVHFITYANPIRLDPGTPHIHYHEVEVSTYPLFQSRRTPKRWRPDVSGSPNGTTSTCCRALRRADSVCAYLAQQMTAPRRRLPFITTLHGTDVTIVGRRVRPSSLPPSGPSRSRTGLPASANSSAPDRRSTSVSGVPSR